MCGICLVVISRGKNISNHQEGKLYSFSRLGHRGPDGKGHVQRQLTNQHEAHFHGCALQFQGPLTIQPIQGCHGNLLLWNGEVFGGLEVLDENDGVKLCAALDKCTTEAEILHTLVSIRGPWAVIYWQAEKQQLWFGRDVFGRRSLLFHRSDEVFSLCSVTFKTLNPWEELPADGIYCMQYSEDTHPVTILYPWKHKIEQHDLEPSACSHDVVNIPNSVQDNFDQSEILQELNIKIGSNALSSCIDNFNRTIPNTNVGSDTIFSAKESSISAETVLRIADSSDIDLANTLIKALSQAVKIRVSCQANKCHRCLQQRLSSKNDGSIAESFIGENRTHSSENHASSFELCDLRSKVKQCTSHYKTDVNDSNISNTTVNTGRELDSSAVGQCDFHTVTGAGKESESSSHCGEDENTACSHARVAVMFSGGIDSLVIAALADRHVPPGEPIDLMNVAFEQKAKPTSQKKKKKVDLTEANENMSQSTYDVPDRLTGLLGLQQLQRLNRDRQWNFIEINVTHEELKTAREDHVRELLYPLRTVLDDSIGCAAWFAARGQGCIRKGDIVQPYTSTARVVLVGMGADEQLAGYSRHRVQFNKCGWQGLVNEIEMEIKRISLRNLGRDDRIISDHSKEARFPFLDEDVVSLLNSIPVFKKANLNLPRGVGEKFLLRVVAVILGLKEGAVLPKRAIQFGSRIAKMENSKEKATDICDRLDNAHMI